MFLGLSIAGSVRVGQAIGDGNTILAKNVTKIASVLSCKKLLHFVFSLGEGGSGKGVLNPDPVTQN